jgi:hypothetical protein
VAAHPDDEILWFSSVLAAAEKVLICYGDVPGRETWTAGRKKSLAEHPLPSVTSLDIIEADVFPYIDWENPAESASGLDVSRFPRNEKAYADNYVELKRVLEDELGEARNVFTHNPWGEYGNAEHVQVFRAVLDVCRDRGTAVWVPGYFSNKASSLLARSSRFLTNDSVTLDTNPVLAGSIADIYKKNGCWTWYDDYRWPESETFMRVRNESDNSETYGYHFPMHCIVVDPTPSPELRRETPSLLVRIRNRLSRMLPGG